MKINREELEAFIIENYDESDSQKKNPIADFLQSLTDRRAFNPMSRMGSQMHGMSPRKHPKFNELERQLEDSKYEDFISCLNHYISQKGMTHPQVYNAAGMTPDCFSKIISGKTKTPKKETVVALALALKLNADDAKDLLSSAGFSLSRFIKPDLIYAFCFQNGPFSVDEVNEILVDYHFKPIGGRQ